MRNLWVCVFIEGSFGKFKNKMLALLPRLTCLEEWRYDIRSTRGFVVQYTQPREPWSWLDRTFNMTHLVVVLISFVLHKNSLAQISDFKSEVTGSISGVDLSKDSAFTHVCSCLKHSEDMTCILKGQLSFTALPLWVLMRTGKHGNRWPYCTQLIEKDLTLLNTISLQYGLKCPWKKWGGTQGCCRCDNSGSHRLTWLLECWGLGAICIYPV